MASLATLPDETLANVLSCSGASDMVISLWLCGDSALNTRISRRGCTSFDANVEEVRKWPALLSRLPSLKRFALRTNHLHDEVEKFTRQLKTLPSTLEELELELPIAWMCFVDLEHGRPLWSIRELFPSLRVLKAVSNRSIVGSAIHLSPEFLRSLPDSLVDFHFDSPLPDETDALPRNLESLRISNHGHSLSVSQLSSLPPKLTSCYGLNRDSRGLSWPHMPRSITAGDFFLSLLHKDISTTLPPLLKTLELNLMTRDAFLPSTLTCLSIAYTSISPTQMAWLPRSLTDLKVETVTWEVGQGYDHLLEPASRSELYALWPPSLVSLRIKDRMRSPKTPDIAFIAFPRTLTLLNGIDIPIGCNNLCDLPPKLSSLKFFREGDQSAFGPLMLPSGLKTVKSSVPCSYLGPWLPDGLTALYLPNALHSELINAQLPPTIETLVLKSIDAGFLSQLPTALTHLKASSLDGLIGADAFMYLPLNLRTLSVNFVYGNSIDFSAFKHVPKRLRVLQMNHFRVPLAIFTHLPTTVLNLTALDIYDFSPATAALIPTHWLSYLLSKRITFPSEHIGMIYRYWPPTKKLTKAQDANLSSFLIFDTRRPRTKSK